MWKTVYIPVSTRYPVLATWTLWRHLLHPPAHPLFERTLKAPAVNLVTAYITGIVPLVGLLGCCGVGMLAQLNSSIAVYLLVAVVGFSSLCVVAWVMSISAAIAREQERRTYDLVSLSPSGALGANWAICAAILHHDDALGWLDLLRKVIAGLLLFILLALLVTTAVKQNALDLLEFFWLLLDIIILSAASYIEHVQSIVLGSLVGMLAPAYSRTRLDARLSAVGVFLTVQAITLAVTLLTVLVIIPGLSTNSRVLLIVLVFCLSREALIIGFWRVLAYHLNADPAAFGL